MKCIVTGTETDHKWDGRPLCKNVLVDAKKYRDKFNADNSFTKMTLRDAIIEVGKEFQKSLKEKYNEHVDERIKEEIKKLETHVVGE